MKIPPKKLLLFGGFLFFGLWTMNNNKFNYYGLIFGDAQIRFYIDIVCHTIDEDTATQAKYLISETVAVETDNGNAKDYSPIYGEGLTQFDRETFEEVIEYFSHPEYSDLREKIQNKLFINILDYDYEDLRTSPLFSIIMTRLKYLKAPQNLPINKSERWLYYKKWWNSTLGSTTIEKYYEASKRSVFL